jgi:hypothetical protein
MVCCLMILLGWSRIWIPITPCDVLALNKNEV